MFYASTETFFIQQYKKKYRCYKMYVTKITTMSSDVGPMAQHPELHFAVDE